MTLGGTIHVTGTNCSAQASDQSSYNDMKAKLLSTEGVTITLEEVEILRITFDVDMTRALGG